MSCYTCFFFFQAEDGIRDLTVTGVQTCALPICRAQVHRRIRCGLGDPILVPKIGIEAAAARHPVLPGTHKELPHHAHLQVLGRGDVAVPEVSPGVRGEIVIGEAGADVDGHRSVRDSIVERGSVGVAVEVDGMLLEQVRAHNHAHVGKGQEELVEQHTVHFHGYPNASSFYDGVPDASVAINIGGSFTYYYLAPDAGTYFWHCHITPPEHLQMGMVGQIYVRPRQNRVPSTTTLY